METAKSVIAVVAQEAANGSCCGAVIDGEAFAVSSWGVGPADRACAALLGEHSSVGAMRHAEPNLELGVGFGVGVLAAPLPLPSGTLGAVMAVAPAGCQGRTCLTPDLCFVATASGDVKLRQRLHGVTPLAYFLDRRHVGRRPTSLGVGVFRAPPSPLVEERAGPASRGQSVLVRLVPIKLVGWFRFVALEAGFRYSRITHREPSSRCGQGWQSGVQPDCCPVF
jgi:hypothetical protein